MAITLRAARINANLTQDQVAKALNVSRCSVSAWESGKADLSAKTFIRLCELYKVNIGDIFLP